jgi:hypothetical protein
MGMVATLREGYGGQMRVEEHGEVLWETVQEYRGGNAYLPNVQALVRVERTGDIKLFRVFVEGVYIGSVREEPKGWMPIGSFVLPLVAIADMAGSSGGINKHTWQEQPGKIKDPCIYNTYLGSMEAAVRLLVVWWVYRLAITVESRRRKLTDKKRLEKEARYGRY